MKKIVLASMIGLAAVGCQNTTKSSKSSTLPTASATSPGSVMDLSSPAATPAYTAPAPTAVQQPVIYDTPAVTSTTPASTTAAKSTVAAAKSGSQYKVQKGDTLFGIAKKSYGDGKQWTRIAEANPGLRPETLKVGQTIAIP